MTAPPQQSGSLSRALAQALNKALGMPARTLQRVAAGTTLQQAGDAVTRLAFLVSGRVDAVLHGRGSEGAPVVPLAFGAGEIVLLSQQRLREVQERERAWVERGVHERVCAALARLAAEQPPRRDGRCLIATTHEQLAARCGVSRPKASTALKRLEQAGRVRLDRGVIEVLDLQALATPLLSPRELTPRRGVVTLAPTRTTRS